MKHLPFVDRFESWGHSSLLESTFPKKILMNCGIFNLTSQTQNQKKCQRSHHEHLRLQPWQAHHPVWRNPRKLCIFRPGIRMGNTTTRKHISPLVQFSVESNRFHLGNKNQKRMAKYFWFSWDGNWTTETDLECGPATACMHGKGCGAVAWSTKNQEKKHSGLEHFFCCIQLLIVY